MKEWYRAKELAGLPGMPGSERVVRIRMQGMQTRMVPSLRGGGCGGVCVEAHLSSLPAATQAYLRARAEAEAQASVLADAKAFLATLPAPEPVRTRGQRPRRTPAPVRPVAPEITRTLEQEPVGPPSPETEREALWAWFERQPERERDAAQQRAELVLAVKQLERNGLGRMQAVAQVGAEHGVHPSTLRDYLKRVHFVPRSEWAPTLLCGRSRSGRKELELSEALWQQFIGDFLRPEAPTLAACYRRVQRWAAYHNEELPSVRTFRRRIQALPVGLRTLAREGEDALMRLYPDQERRHDSLHALEGVNADGHRFDVFVKWDDDTISRPVGVFWQDIYSGRILSHRIDQSENKETVRLSFSDLVHAHGVPDHAWLDNGRGFASKWITGGMPNRFRFKVRDEEPEGVLKLLGVQVHWATPYHGQAKPIERAFRDLCENVSKHPAFSGAYTGNKPSAKPENYGSRAIPIAEFERILTEELHLHNTRTGRTSAVCQGRSFEQVWLESLSEHPARVATEAQKRLLLLAAEQVRLNSDDASLRLEGNRYWCEQLTAWRGQPVVVRFDPRQLHSAVFVYSQDGEFIARAACVQAAGFADVEAAQAHTRARNEWKRGEKLKLKATRRLEAAQVAAALPPVAVPEQAPKPEQATNLVRPTFGQPVSNREAEELEVHRRFTAALEQLGGPRKW